MFSLVRVPSVSPETVRVEHGFRHDGCWHEPRGLRARVLVKARWEGVRDA